jgi:transketolase
MVMDMRTSAISEAIDLLDRDPRVAILLAEISVDRFSSAMQRHPSRVVNVGIMEQTMVGLAAGFAMEGFHPIAHTIAPFLAERALEQIKLDFGYQGLAGTFLSVGASYDYASEGGTHHAPGDVQVMLSIPGMEVFVPGHPAEIASLLRATYADGRPAYLRASAAQNDVPFDVVPGRINVVRRGSKATILAIGPMLTRTLEASEGLDVAVLYATSVHPFDVSALAQVSGEGAPLVIVEPCYAGTVATALGDGPLLSRPDVASIGVARTFLHHYGTAAEHDRALELDARGIRRRLAAVLDESAAGVAAERTDREIQ